MKSPSRHWLVTTRATGLLAANVGVVWARADRPSQMLVEVATSDSLRNARVLPPVAALPESDFTAKMLLENLPAGQDIFYRVRFRDLSHTDVSSEPSGRPLPHRAGRPPRRQLRLGRRCRRAGLGHQSRRWRHADLRNHAPAPAGFPAAFRRHHLCRRHHYRRGERLRCTGQAAARTVACQDRRDVNQVRPALRDRLWRQRPAPGDRKSAVAAASKASSNRTKLQKGGLRGRRRPRACPTTRLSCDLVGRWGPWRQARVPAPRCFILRWRRRGTPRAG